MKHNSSSPDSQYGSFMPKRMQAALLLLAIFIRIIIKIPLARIRKTGTPTFLHTGTITLVCVIAVYVCMYVCAYVCMCVHSYLPPHTLKSENRYTNGFIALLQVLLYATVQTWYEATYIFILEGFCTAIYIQLVGARCARDGTPSSVMQQYKPGTKRHTAKPTITLLQVYRNTHGTYIVV